MGKQYLGSHRSLCAAWPCLSWAFCPIRPCVASLVAPGFSLATDISKTPLTLPSRQSPPGRPPASGYPCRLTQRPSAMAPTQRLLEQLEKTDIQVGASQSPRRRETHLKINPAPLAPAPVLTCSPAVSIPATIQDRGSSWQQGDKRQRQEGGRVLAPGNIDSKGPLLLLNFLI